LTDRRPRLYLREPHQLDPLGQKSRGCGGSAPLLRRLRDRHNRGRSDGPSCYDGLPYAVAESVFDDYGQEDRILTGD
jgi:hypothetical protein